MADDVRLTAEERGWFDSWRDRCDEDPALQRHEGYIEMAADILRYRVQAAHAEDAARLAEVERLARTAQRDMDAANARVEAETNRASTMQAFVLVSDLDAALGVTAPTASEAGDERDQACVDRWPGCEIGAYDPRCCRRRYGPDGLGGDVLVLVGAVRLVRGVVARAAAHDPLPWWLTSLGTHGPTHFGPDVHRADYGMHGTACKPVLVLPLDGLEETIARVLGEHGWTWKAFTQRPKEAECTAPGCDWTWRVPLSGDIDPVAIHEAEKAHRADAIARALAGDGAR